MHELLPDGKHGLQADILSLTRTTRAGDAAQHSHTVGPRMHPTSRAGETSKHKAQGAELVLSTCHIPKCARTKCTGENWRAGEQAGLGPTARGTGAAPPTHGKARHACCLRCDQTSPGFNSRGTSFHVVLELEQVKPVDQRSAMQFGAH